MQNEIKSESAPGKLPVGVSYSVFDELQAEAAPAQAGGHTPGPWEVSGTSIISGEICIAVIEDDGGYEAPSEQREANARLIASAPALLAERDRLVEALTRVLFERDRLRDAANKVEAALLPYRGPDMSPEKTYLVSRAAVQQLRAALEGGKL